MAKRLLLIFLGILIAANISGCGKKTESIGIRPDLPGLDIGESIDRFDIYSVTRTEIDPAYIAAAELEFKKRFGIELNITASMSIDTSGMKSAQQVKSTGADGLYLFPYASISRITELAESGSIIPIEKFLIDNPVWNELPVSMRKMYQDADGHIWALPRGFTPVVMGRVFRADYLSELDLAVPTNLDMLYEVSKEFAYSDPDRNGINDTYGMVYNNAGGFRDIFYANGVPVNTSNDGFQRTSISYNTIYESFEDSMLMDNMPGTMEYLVKLSDDGIIRKLSGRSSGNVSNFSGDKRIANSFISIPGYIFTDDKYVVASGISGTETKNLNPLTYDFLDGFYLLGANTENPSATINTFVSMMFGDLEAYLFASRGMQGNSYVLNMDTVEVSDKSFFSYGQEALVKSNPLFTYETMNLDLNYELASSGFLGDLINNYTARDMYIETAMASEIMYDITMDFAYPEVFISKPGELINSSSGTMFDSQFERLLTGSVSVSEAINTYKKNMRILGMEYIINDLNEKIGAVTKFHY